MKLFFDNNLPPAGAEGVHAFLRSENHSAVHLRTKFPQQMPDVDWLDALHAEGDWVVLTLDDNIARRPEEKERWRDRNLLLYFVPWAWNQLKLPRKRSWLLEACGEVVEHARAQRPGTAFRIGLRDFRFKRLPL